MNLVDSCGWLEYLADGPNAEFFAPALIDTAHLVVPSIAIYEVFKRVAMQRGEDAAFEAVGLLHQGLVIETTSALAVSAARLSVAHKLSMADALILATARQQRAELWTQDAHFEGLPGVRYVDHRPAS